MINLDNEFKKLNYGLGSYPCIYHADYELIEEDNSIKLLLLDQGDMEILSYKFPMPITIEEINRFKKQAINICSHVKKKRA
jgi:hypothetical protein